MTQKGDSAFDASFTNTKTGNSLTATGSGQCSASFGGKSKAEGKRAVAQGTQCYAKASYSHAEGNNTYTEGGSSHAEGLETGAYGSFSHSEGNNTNAKGNQSHSEGNNTNANGENSHSEGQQTTASGLNAHSEGYLTEAAGEGSHAEGYSTKSQTTKYSTGGGSGGGGSGIDPTPTDPDWNIENQRGKFTHTEGVNTIASGWTSHAEGAGAVADGHISHAEGESTLATGRGAHAEGAGSIASGDFSHAEGSGNQTQGKNSFATGNSNIVSGVSSAAFGTTNTVTSDYNFASGQGLALTTHESKSAAAFGSYNKDGAENIFQIGGGTSNADRKNLLSITSGGDVYTKGTTSNSHLQRYKLLTASDLIGKGTETLAYWITGSGNGQITTTQISSIGTVAGTVTLFGESHPFLLKKGSSLDFTNYIDIDGGLSNAFQGKNCKYRISVTTTFTCTHLYYSSIASDSYAIFHCYSVITAIDIFPQYMAHLFINDNDYCCYRIYQTGDNTSNINTNIYYDNFQLYSLQLTVFNLISFNAENYYAYINRSVDISWSYNPDSSQSSTNVYYYKILPASFLSSIY